MEKRKGSLLLTLLVLVCGWAYMFSVSRGITPFTELLLASLLYLACCIPVLTYFGQKNSTVPYLPVLGCFYFIYYGSAVFLNYNKIFLKVSFGPGTVAQCLLLALIGFVLLLAGFHLPVAQTLRTIGVIKPLKVHWDDAKAYRIGLIVGLIGNAVMYFSLTRNILVQFGGFVSFLTDLSKLGIVILFLLQLKGKLNLRSKFVLWGLLFIPRVLLDLGTGFIFTIIFDFVLLFFVYFYERKVIPWVKIVIAIGLIAIMLLPKAEFRYLTWGTGEYASLNPVDKGVLYVRLIWARAFNRSESGYEDAYENVTSRMDYLFTFAVVRELTPKYIPYWDGETYNTFLTSFIPRVIMPDKPIKDVGQTFGHRYLLLDSSDTATSYNLPFFIEMFVNFGEWGIFFGMFLLGLIFRIFYIILNDEDSGEGIAVISVMIFSNLLNIESDFSLIFGHILQYAVLFYFIVRMMKPSTKKNKIVLNNIDENYGN